MSKISQEFSFHRGHGHCSLGRAMRTARPTAARLLRGMIVLALVSANQVARAAEPAKTPPAKPAPSAPAAEPGAATSAGEPRQRPNFAVAVPAFDDAFEAVPVARVGGEVVTVGELMQGVAAAHDDRKMGATGKQDFKVMLDRLIDLKLFVLEARASELDEDPAFQKELAEYKESAARMVLEKQVTKDVKADPAVTEQFFRFSVREWKLQSVLFEKEETAKELTALLKQGESFKAAAAKLVAEKKATAGDETGYVPDSALAPNVKQALASTKVGDVTPPLPVSKGYTVLRVEDIRYPENEDARQQATAASRDMARADALRAFKEGLQKRYVTKYDRKLLASIDYHAPKPGPKGYLKDKRALVSIRGESPITVADLTNAIGAEFFHGFDEPVKDKRVNPKKEPALESLLQRRLMSKEARARDVQASFAYKRAIDNFSNERLFGVYLQKVIVPELKVKEEDLRAYYDANQQEFGTPALYTLDGIGFSSKAKAEAALKLLGSGTDLNWLKQNADGLAPEGKREPDLEGHTLTQSSMPKQLQGVLSGMNVGDRRIYDAPAGATYVLTLTGHVPQSTAPYEDVRKAIHKKVFGKKLQASMADWSAKLRQAYPVEVFMTSLDR